MKHERSLRVFLGLGIMAATVTAVGSLGGWSSPEPPAEHGATPKVPGVKPVKPDAKPDARAESKPEAVRSEPTRLEPVWSEPAKTG